MISNNGLGAILDQIQGSAKLVARSKGDRVAFNSNNVTMEPDIIRKQVEIAEIYARTSERAQSDQRTTTVQPRSTSSEPTYEKRMQNNRWHIRNRREDRRYVKWELSIFCFFTALKCFSVLVTPSMSVTRLIPRRVWIDHDDGSKGAYSTQLVLWSTSSPCCTMLNHCYGSVIRRSTV